MVAYDQLEAAVDLLNQAPIETLVRLLRTRAPRIHLLCRAIRHEPPLDRLLASQPNNVDDDDDHDSDNSIVSEHNTVNDVQESPQPSNNSSIATTHNVDGVHANQHDSVNGVQESRHPPNDSIFMLKAASRSQIIKTVQETKRKSQVNSIIRKITRGIELVEAHFKQDISSVIGEPQTAGDIRLRDILVDPQKATPVQKLRDTLASWTYGIELELFEMKTVGPSESTVAQVIDHPDWKVQGALGRFTKDKGRLYHATRLGTRYRVLDCWAAVYGYYGVSILFGFTSGLTRFSLLNLRAALDAMMLTTSITDFLKNHHSVFFKAQVEYIKQCKLLHLDKHEHFAEVLKHVLTIHLRYGQQLSSKRRRVSDAASPPKRRRVVRSQDARSPSSTQCSDDSSEEYHDLGDAVNSWIQEIPPPDEITPLPLDEQDSFDRASISSLPSDELDNLETSTPATSIQYNMPEMQVQNTTSMQSQISGEEVHQYSTAGALPITPRFRNNSWPETVYDITGPMMSNEAFDGTGHTSNGAFDITEAMMPSLYMSNEVFDIKEAMMSKLYMSNQAFDRTGPMMSNQVFDETRHMSNEVFDIREAMMPNLGATIRYGQTTQSISTDMMSSH